MTSTKEISILGCGWYGFALAKILVAKGFKVKGSTTSAEKMSVLEQSGILPYKISFEEEDQYFDKEFFSAPLLLIAIPPKRSSGQQHTFLPKIKKIMAAAIANRVKQIIFISSTSVYGDHNHEVDESTPAIPDTASGQAILSAERWLQSSEDFNTTVIRFGGLIGPDRNPGRFFAGKHDVPNGQAPVNLIELHDCIGITMAILEKEAYGKVYNACATDHPSRAQFYTAASTLSHLPPPQFIDELLRWKIVNSINVSEELGYVFNSPLHPLAAQ